MYFRAMKILTHIGQYVLMLQKTFGKFTKWNVLRNLILREIDDLIIGSLGIIAFISFFVGGVVAIQTAINTDNPLLPGYLVGFATRQSIILEFAPTFISVIMAGKVGSFITSSLGTMRVTEQIDALEVMGINTYNYLIFPKIAALTLYPFLISISMTLGFSAVILLVLVVDFPPMQILLKASNLISKPFILYMHLLKHFCLLCF